MFIIFGGIMALAAVVSFFVRSIRDAESIMPDAESIAIGESQY